MERVTDVQSSNVRLLIPSPRHNCSICLNDSGARIHKTKGICSVSKVSRECTPFQGMIGQSSCLGSSFLDYSSLMSNRISTTILIPSSIFSKELCLSKYCHNVLSNRFSCNYHSKTWKGGQGKISSRLVPLFSH